MIDFHSIHWFKSWRPKRFTNRRVEAVVETTNFTSCNPMSSNCEWCSGDSPVSHSCMTRAGLDTEMLLTRSSNTFDLHALPLPSQWCLWISFVSQFTTEIRQVLLAPLGLALLPQVESTHTKIKEEEKSTNTIQVWRCLGSLTRAVFWARQGSRNSG